VILNTSKERCISVVSVLSILGVSSSGYYSFKRRKPSKQKERKQVLKEKINDIYKDSKQIYGAPKITHILKAQGYTVSQKTVSNYMKEEGIKAVWIKPYVKTTINPDFSSALKNILKREFNPVKPNKVWVTDITYIKTNEGFVYLTSIMDLYSRKIISWNISDNLSVKGVINTVTKAKYARNIYNPLVIHSDRGSQYTSEEYRIATSNLFKRSYSRRGNPWDNACIESFHSLIKREWINRFEIEDINHAKSLVFEYIEAFYNTVRIHSHCGMKSPHYFELQYINNIY
jgi:putative transposase